MARTPDGSAGVAIPDTIPGRRDGQVERARRTHDTLSTLSNGLEPESLYTPGYFKGTDEKGTDASIFDDKKDLSRTALETATDYTGRLTQGEISHQGRRRINKSNTFAIDGDLQFGPESSKELTTSTPVAGAATQIKNSGRTLGSFLDVARQLDSRQANRFENASVSDYGDGENSKNPFLGDNPVIDKTSGRDGHTLLPSIVGNERPNRVGAPAVFSDSSLEALSPAQQKVSDVLKLNRFNPSNKTPFMVDHTRSVEEVRGKVLTKTGATKQGVLGKYIRDAEHILETDLKSVGGQVTAAATGQGDFSKYADEDGAINFDGLKAAMKLTGWQLIDSSKMRASKSDAAENILSDNAGSKMNLLTDREDSDSVSSYGTLNSSSEPFAGPMPLSMVFHTLISIGSLVAFAGLVASVGIISRKIADGDSSSVKHVGQDTTRPQDMALGRHALKSAAVEDYFLKLFRIPIVENDFELCLAAGILAFYGLDELPQLFAKPSARSIVDAAFDNLSLNILDNFRDITSSAGYYSIITRAAARDVKQISKAFSGFKGLSPSGSFVQIFKVIDSIVESTTWKFLMTLAAMGDKIISSLSGHPTIGGDVAPSDTRPAPERYYSNRDLSGRLTWRHGALPSKYIMPKVFRRAFDTSTAANFKLAALKQRDDDTGAFTETSRLSKTDVRLLESRLNLEYMPFYFHDIRTNEIIAFHAFLSNLSDDYSADYATTSAYGRGDDIKIYNKTSRSIQLKFVLAATSKEDLNVMYWNLNKLVSMVYPQWSRGRSVINGSGINAEKFIQPFSQIPTASPLIRIRLGDVMTSNYSKFGLMRLFGLGEGEDVFTLDRGPGEVSKESQAKYESEKSAAEINLLRAKTYRKVDPGAPDSVQLQTLISAFGPPPSHDAANALVADNTQFGYQIGDLVNITPQGDSSGKGYWPRDNTGKLSKKFRNSSEAKRIEKFIINYHPFKAEVEIVQRVPDGASPLKQNETHFEKHVPASDIKAEKERDTAATAAGQNYFGEMAYLVKVRPGSVEDAFFDRKNIPKNLRFHRVTHSMILGLSPEGERRLSQSVSPPVADVRQLDPKRLADFFDSKNNYLVRAFESTMGKGLAGFIGSLNIDWKLNESNWEIEQGSRAPKLIEISINFSPIHDIPLGLDSSGMMRSVAYNVGEYSAAIGQSPSPIELSEILDEEGLIEKSENPPVPSEENIKKSNQIAEAKDAISNSNKVQNTIGQAQNAAKKVFG